MNTIDSLSMYRYHKWAYCIKSAKDFIHSWGTPLSMTYIQYIPVKEYCDEHNIEILPHIGYIYFPNEETLLAFKLRFGV